MLITDGDPQEMYKCQEQSKAAYRDGINLFIVGTYFICYRRNPKPLLPPVCHCGGGGGRGWLPSMHHGSHDQGVLHPGGSASRASRAVCIWERSASGGGLHRGEGGWAVPPALQDTVNKRVVHILLECIIVKYYDDLSLPYNKESNLTHLYTV